MIILFSPWMIIFLVLCVLAAIYGIIQNIGSIILISIIVIVLLLLLVKWPKKTLISLACISIIALAIIGISSSMETNNTPVTIYEASNKCVIYNEANEIVEIPQGAIVARYKDPKVKSQEASTDAFSQMCVWYYEGQIYTSTVSIRHSMEIMIQEYDYAPNIWNLVEVKEITFREFQNSNWWES